MLERNHLDLMIYFKQKRVRPDFRGAYFVLPLLPARFCPWGSATMTVTQTAAHDRIGRDGTGGRETQSRWSGPGLAEETKSDPAGASGTLREDVDPAGSGGRWRSGHGPGIKALSGEVPWRGAFPHVHGGQVISQSQQAPPGR